MNLIKFVALFFSIIFIVISISDPIKFQATPLKKLNPQFVESMSFSPTPDEAKEQSAPNDQTSTESSSGHRSIREQTYNNYYLSDKYPVTINKDVEHHINENYTEDTVCLSIEATNIGDRPLDNIEIYELASPQMELINCSTPVIVSSINEYLKYISENWLLTSDDLSNQRGLARTLANSKSLTNLTIKFSKDDLAILENTSEESKSRIKYVLLNRFNEFILNNKLDNQLKYLNKEYLSQQTIDLLNIENVSGLQRDDSKLLSFLVLRDSYESFIKKPNDFIKINKNYNMETKARQIHIFVPRLNRGESIIFKFYASLSNFEPQTSKTIISISDDKYPRYAQSISVSMPTPQFSVSGDYSKQEVQPNDNISINYIIQLLNPMDHNSQYKFNAHVEKNDYDVHLLKDHNFQLSFCQPNYTCNQTVTMAFNESGIYNIPSLSIGNYEYGIIDKEIKVDPLWNKYILEITIMIIAFCTILGNNLIELRKRKYLKYRICLVVLFILIILIICILCKFYTLLYYPLIIFAFFIISLSVPIYWWYNSL